jgi:spermidine/putrescine-binding protein
MNITGLDTSPLSRSLSRRRLLGLTAAGAVSVLAACGSAAPSAPSQAPAGSGSAAAAARAGSTSSGTFPPAVQALIDGAKKEGTFNLFDQTPTTPENAAKLVDAFNARFGLNMKLNQVQLTTFDVDTRILAAHTAGKPMEADSATVAIEDIITWHEKGLLEPFDWVGTFGSIFPDIKKRIMHIPAEYQNETLEFWHLAYGIEYRTDRFSQADIPKTWEGVADPKFKGQLVLDSVGSPLYYFAPFWGIDRVLKVAALWKQAQPLYKKGSQAIANAVATGEGSVAVTSIGTVEFAKSKGVPVDWTTPDEIPFTIKYNIVPKGAPHINTARLWSAWITTEGRLLFEQLERDGLAWPGEDSYLSKRLADLGTKFNYIETAEQGKQTTDAQKRIGDLYLKQ